MKYEIAVRVDTNDADYVWEVTEIDDEELTLVMPLIEAIKKFKSYKSKGESGSTWTHSNNYPRGECLREDLGQKDPREYYGFPEEVHEIFEELCGYHEYGFHTIETITLTPSVEKTILL